MGKNKRRGVKAYPKLSDGEQRVCDRVWDNCRQPDEDHNLQRVFSDGRIDAVPYSILVAPALYPGVEQIARQEERQSLAQASSSPDHGDSREAVDCSAGQRE